MALYYAVLCATHGGLHVSFTVYCLHLVTLNSLDLHTVQECTVNVLLSVL